MRPAFEGPVRDGGEILCISIQGSLSSSCRRYVGGPVCWCPIVVSWCGLALGAVPAAVCQQDMIISAAAKVFCTGSVCPTGIAGPWPILVRRCAHVVICSFGNVMGRGISTCVVFVHIRQKVCSMGAIENAHDIGLCGRRCITSSQQRARIDPTHANAIVHRLPCQSYFFVGQQCGITECVFDCFNQNLCSGSEIII